MTEKNPNQVFLCSTLAGIICNSLTNPLDVIKVRLQNDAKKCHCTQPSLCVNRSSPISKSSCIGNASLLKIARCRNIESEYRVLCGCLPFKTNTRALVYLVRKEGLLTLANGMLQGVTSSTLSSVAFFSVYEAIRKEVTKVTQNAILVPFYSALFARTVTTTLIFPFEYMKTVQQSSVGKNKVSVFKIGRSAHAGYTSLMVRDIVFACVNWVLVENIRGFIKGVLQTDATGYQDKKTLLISNFISGGIAGGIGSLVSIPFDVVKTRKQLHPKEYRHKSILQILREVYELEGRRGLFLGARQRVWKVTFQAAGILTLYEFFMDLMGNRQLEMVKI